MPSSRVAASLILVSCLSLPVNMAIGRPEQQADEKGGKEQSSEAAENVNSVQAMVRTINAQAIEAMRNRRFDDAKRLFASAIVELRKRRPNDPAMAPLLGNLATCYLQLGKQREAELIFKRALEIKATAADLNGQEYAAMHDALGRIYLDQGRTKEAREQMMEALHIFERAKHPDALNLALNLSNIATLDASLHDDSSAESLLKRALALVENELGANHIESATIMRKLADLYKRHGRYGEAEPLYKKALAIDQTTLGVHHPYSIQTAKNYADLLHLLHRNREAAQILPSSPAFKEVKK